MGRPWWHDSYWEKNKKPGRNFRPTRRIPWGWILVLAITLLLTISSSSSSILGFFYFLCRTLSFVIIIRVVLTWFPKSRYHPVVLLLDSVTEPILSRLRRYTPRSRTFDFTPLIALFALYIISVVLRAILY